MNFIEQGKTGWIFSGFLFVVGMTIPFSIMKRYAEGQDTYIISKHIVIRTISLIIMGILMLNIERIDPELTGMRKNIWTLLMYIGLFLTWNDYKENDKNFFTITGIKLIGMALLTFLVFKFQSGEPENEGSFITSWWGFLGLAGWGFLVVAFIYLAVKNDFVNAVVALLFFLSMNILDKLNLLTALDTLKPLIGVITGGNIPMIILSGMLTAIIFKKYSDNQLKQIKKIFLLGIVTILTGFSLHEAFMTLEIPGKGLIFSGSSMILFSLVYWITEVKKLTRGTIFIKTSGVNSLTVYIISKVVYTVILLNGFSTMIYNHSNDHFVSAVGSFIWTFLILELTALLAKKGIRLKI